MTGEGQKSLQEHLREIVEQSVGNVDLTPLIERATEEVFFQPRYVRQNYGPSKELPPLLHEIVAEVLQERMREAVRAWISSHEDEVKEIVAEVVRDGAGAAAVNGFTRFFSQTMSAMENDIIARLQRNL